jgi:hypothetical protein
MVSGEPFGNPYATERAGGEAFSERDEEAVDRLAGFAGVAGLIWGRSWGWRRSGAGTWCPAACGSSSTSTGGGDWTGMSE